MSFVWNLTHNSFLSNIPETLTFGLIICVYIYIYFFLSNKFLEVEKFPPLSFLVIPCY